MRLEDILGPHFCALIRRDDSGMHITPLKMVKTPQEIEAGTQRRIRSSAPSYTQRVA
jgi:hypothetical protein